MKYDTIIAGGTVVTAEGQKRADVAIKGQKIAAVGKGLAKSSRNGTVMIDAKGKYVMPGAIDVHVHLELPFSGTLSSEDWNTGTRAPPCGCVTTLIDLAIPFRNESLQTP